MLQRKRSNDRTATSSEVVHDLRLDTDQLVFLIKLYPQALAERDRDGSLPLHLAASGSGASHAVFIVLLSFFPTALRGARKYGASMEQIELLVKAYPDAVTAANIFGDLLVHTLPCCTATKVMCVCSSF